MIRTQQELLEAMERGSHLRETRIHQPEEKAIWNLVETGEGVHATAVRLVRQTGRLQPLRDGLFGEAQTYALGEAA